MKIEVSKNTESNLSFIFKGIPMIIAMIILNELNLGASRFSIGISPSEAEKTLYEKWLAIFKTQINHCYPKLDSETIDKLAVENARYLLSVFSPTTITCSMSPQQWFSIIAAAESYIELAHVTSFTFKVKQALRDFLSAKPDIDTEGLEIAKTNRSFKLFAVWRTLPDEWSESYCTTYRTSFLSLFHAYRSETISYQMSLPYDQEFFLPPLFEYTPYQKEWLEDIQSLSGNYPQGMHVDVIERDTCKGFIEKCTNDLCGHSHLENMIRTEASMRKYVSSAKVSNPKVYAALEPYSHGACCTFPNYSCANPCIFGGKKAMTRVI